MIIYVLLQSARVLFGLSSWIRLFTEGNAVLLFGWLTNVIQAALKCTAHSFTRCSMFIKRQCVRITTLGRLCLVVGVEEVTMPVYTTLALTHAQIHAGTCSRSHVLIQPTWDIYIIIHSPIQQSTTLFYSALLFLFFDFHSKALSKRLNVCLFPKEIHKRDNVKCN